jgi:hypothetical protein
MPQPYYFLSGGDFSRFIEVPSRYRMEYARFCGV